MKLAEMLGTKGGWCTQTKNSNTFGARTMIQNKLNTLDTHLSQAPTRKAFTNFVPAQLRRALFALARANDSNEPLYISDTYLCYLVTTPVNLSMIGEMGASVIVCSCTLDLQNP